ncbi:MAG: GxxExxY protein [Planctomycetaceae bacterium]|nr:GxxExxY protein [Planctomycetaceae bacterium]
MSKLLFESETYAIRGAVFNVYREIGCGFLEAVYQECLEREFTFQKIPFVAQKELRLYYRDEMINKAYQADFLCYDKIIVEIKSVLEITNIHNAQVINYLKMSKLKLGLLVNFGGANGAVINRIVN